MVQSESIHLRSATALLHALCMRVYPRAARWHQIWTVLRFGKEAVRSVIICCEAS